MLNKKIISTLIIALGISSIAFAEARFVMETLSARPTYAESGVAHPKDFITVTINIRNNGNETGAYYLVVRSPGALGGTRDLVQSDIGVLQTRENKTISKTIFVNHNPGATYNIIASVSMWLDEGIPEPHDSKTIEFSDLSVHRILGVGPLR